MEEVAGTVPTLLGVGRARAVRELNNVGRHRDILEARSSMQSDTRTRKVKQLLQHGAKGCTEMQACQQNQSGSRRHRGLRTRGRCDLGVRWNGDV